MGALKNQVETFIDNLNPYRKKYCSYEFIGNSIFKGYDWRFKERFLSDSIIVKAIEGTKEAAFYITNYTSFVAFDIDDHKGRGIGYLMSIYDRVVEKVGVNPSLIFKSPRGMHLYYLFNQKVPTDIVCRTAKDRLNGVRVEIKPTQNTSLRIPRESTCIDPETMQALNLPYPVLFSKALKYHPAQVFDETVLPEVVRKSLTSRRHTLKILKEMPAIEQLENSLMPFVSGNTNNTFLTLCNKYRCCKLDIDEAYFRFSICLENSPFYFGDLRNPKRLKQRIKAEYKKNADFVPVPRSPEKGIFTDTIIDNIVSLSPFAPQRNQPIRRFLSNLLSWKAYQDSILNDKRELAIWDYLYPYYRGNRKEGLYPLPKSLLRRWNDRYNELLPFMKKIGLLKASIYCYSKNLHICKYYKINDEKFLF